LQLRDKLIALTYDILVLLVLVIGPVGLDDTAASHSVDGAGNPASSNELGEIAAVDMD